MKISTWREMEQYDVLITTQIASAYWDKDYYESHDTFLNKYNRSMGNSYMYQNAGYIYAHPWDYKLIPVLNEPLPIVNVNCLHVHDIVLTRLLRGNGIGTEIIKKLQSENDLITLVSTNDRIDYWKRLGFFLTERKCNYGKQMIFVSNR
jgi:GNAT superfamily N-acetyltransferase